VSPAVTWATTSQVAESAGIHETTVGRWLKLGLLPKPEIMNMGRRGRTMRWPRHAPAQAKWVKEQLGLGFSFDEVRGALERGEFSS
jgi:DNA-binding transcriptional MerR regulator